MFSNFKDTFVKKPQFTMKTPESVLDVISKDLPEGFRYIEDHDGFCRLDCDGVMDFTPVCIRLPEEAKSLFAQKNNFSMNDVVAYAYNAQQNIDLIPDKDGCYTVNGQKIAADKFIIAPMKNWQLKDGRMCITAPPFPPPFPIEVAGNGFSLTLMVQRQPVNSITEVKIATVEEGALSMNYSFDPTKKNGKMKINITMCSSKSVSDVLASKEIFNAFIQGKGTLCGMPIKTDEENQVSVVPDEVIQFWHKIVEIEKVFNVKFDASQELVFEDVKRVEELYRCLIEKEPFKTYLKDNTVRGTGKFDEILNEEGIKVGKEILFEYEERIQMELLGVVLKFSALVGIFDSMIGEIKMPEDGISGDFLMKLLPAKGKRMYAATQYYLEENAPEIARKNHHHIQKFQEARELDDTY
ncbi:abortive infection system toxin AbiGii family protein [Lachnospiraceae bacterium 38-14]|uniref:abortive infection system toxin AbiGii family protein n=1 Tax=Roseburia sp. 1XD42-69 TaxID=2320088 RepID=UPI000EA02013|nr:abortive infection system toxin AbiGii family protein [Roseburia sp. 1XD42-69]RKJ61686.1 hypothetical protein D7Y06_19510 [Roseburia sp. 1XD42-69]